MKHFHQILRLGLLAASLGAGQAGGPTPAGLPDPTPPGRLKVTLMLRGRRAAKGLQSPFFGFGNLRTSQNPPLALKTTDNPSGPIRSN